jgi:hypothetical protein
VRRQRDLECLADVEVRAHVRDEDMQVHYSVQSAPGGLDSGRRAGESGLELGCEAGAANVVRGTLACRGHQVADGGRAGEEVRG